MTQGVAQTHGAAQAEGVAALPPPRLVKAAHEFEAQMMKELMAPLTRGSLVPGAEGGADGSGDGDDQASGSGGALGEFAAESLGQALSAAGGFGVATQIIGELGHAGNQRPQSR